PHELLLKLFFPPCRWTKESHEFVRNVLEPSSAELPQDVAQFFVCIHRREMSRVGAFLLRGHEPSILHACYTTTAKNNFRAPVVASRIYIMSENGGDPASSTSPCSQQRWSRNGQLPPSLWRCDLSGFLDVPGASLKNNLTERVLQLATRQRKNAH